MILTYSYIFFIFIISVIAFHKSTFYDFDNFVYLVTDIQQFYRARSIYIVHGESHGGFDSNNVLFHLLKQFSLRNIWSQGLPQSEFYEIYNRKISRNSRQLIVLIIQNDNHLKKFEDFTRINTLSTHVWLTLFWSEQNSTLSYFCRRPTSNRLRLNFDIRMLVKCLDDQSIQEWYALSPDEDVIVSDLFNWSPEAGIIRKTKKALFERRADFKGETVKVANIQEHIDVIESGEKDKRGIKVDVVGKIITEVIKQLKFSIKYCPPANTYGVYNESEGSWNGILGNLSRVEIDIAFGEFGMSPRRSESFDFTLPLFKDTTELYIKSPERYMVKWNAYAKAFDNRIWISILIIIFIATVIITIIKINLKISYWGKTNFLENYICVWGIYCQQSLPEFPASSSLRIAYVSLFFSAIVISAAYSGSIVRNLTNLSPWLPFTSFEEFASINSYKLIIMKNSHTFEYFKYTNDPVLLKMAKMMKSQDELPKVPLEGFKQICNENAAFYTTRSVKNRHAKAVPCLIKGIPEGGERFVAVALTKNSPLTSVINYQIQRFYEYGLIKRSKNKYKELMQYPLKQYDPVGLWEVTSVFLILILGLAVGLLALLFEYINHRGIQKNELQTLVYKKRRQKKFVHFVE